MGLLSNRPVRVVAVEVPAPDCLDPPRCANQRLEIPAILAGHFLRRFQQFLNPTQNDIFGFVEDVISFSRFYHVPHLLSYCSANDIPGTAPPSAKGGAVLSARNRLEFQPFHCDRANCIGPLRNECHQNHNFPASKSLLLTLPHDIIGKGFQFFIHRPSPPFPPPARAAFSCAGLAPPKQLVYGAAVQIGQLGQLGGPWDLLPGFPVRYRGLVDPEPPRHFALGKPGPDSGLRKSYPDAHTLAPSHMAFGH